VFDENAYKVLYYKSHKTSFDGSQLAALKSLYSWRDRIAREEDESTSYVLPDLMLVHIAELLPK
jgi:exosome complex exonuclease RRP6